MKLLKLFASLILAAVLSCCAGLPQQVDPVPLLPSTATPTPDALASYYGNPEPAVLRVNGEEQISGVGAYSWWRTPTEQVNMGGIGIDAPTQPITATVPFSAALILPVPLQPTRLEAALYPVSRTDRLGHSDSTSSGAEYSSWQTHDYEAMRLTLEYPREQQFIDLPECLYVYSIHVEWENLGSVSYGFLVYIQNPAVKLDPETLVITQQSYPAPAVPSMPIGRPYPAP